MCTMSTAIRISRICRRRRRRRRRSRTAGHTHRHDERGQEGEPDLPLGPRCRPTLRCAILDGDLGKEGKRESGITQRQAARGPFWYPDTAVTI